MKTNNPLTTQIAKKAMDVEFNPKIEFNDFKMWASRKPLWWRTYIAYINYFFINEPFETTKYFFENSFIVRPYVKNFKFLDCDLTYLN